MISPLQSGQWLPHPAPEPLARTYAPQRITAKVTPSVAHANVRKRSLFIGRRRSTPCGRRAQRLPRRAADQERARACYIARPRMALRDAYLDKLDGGSFDVLVLGGWHQRSGLGRGALGPRGARVALIDRGDFAGITSQQSSNLAWGGIKYLENFELGLVRKLCVSRNHLIQSYPSTVQEIRFYAAHERGFRHGLWKLVLGTWLYWLIGAFFTKRPRRLSLAPPWRGRSRSSLSTAATGASSTRTRTCTTTTPASSGTSSGGRSTTGAWLQLRGVRERAARRRAWAVKARDVMTGREMALRGRVLVNACGPFVDEQNAVAGQATRARHVFSKGVHLLVERLTRTSAS